MRIFKYLTPDRTDVIENRLIRFTQANYLNDPFESLPFIEKIMDDENLELFYDKQVAPIIDQIGERKLSINDVPSEYQSQIPQEIIDQLSTYSLKEALELIPSLNLKGLSKQLFTKPGDKFKFSERLKYSWSQIFGILSLTTSNSNITMWSHYAKNHEGFVIEFNPKHKFFKTELSDNSILRNLKKVKYSKNRPQMNLVNFKMNEQDYIDFLANNILFTKSIDWEYENELRLVHDLRNHTEKLEFNNQEIYLFKMEPSLIKSVFIGVNANESTIEKIKAALNMEYYSHVKIYTGQLDNKKYEILFE